MLIENNLEMNSQTEEQLEPKEILILFSEKKTKKRWHQTRTPVDKTRLNNLTSQLRN